MHEIAVFVALGVEMAPLKALLSSADQVSRDIPIYVGQMEGKREILVRSGVGRERALAAAKRLYSMYFPQAVLSAGFCGGLISGLRPSDVVLSSWVVSCDRGCHRDSNKLLLRDKALLLESALQRQGIRAHVGGFASASRPVLSTSERTTLTHRSGAVVVEMETFHLAAFFLAQGISFAGMRIVVDGLEDGIPPLDPAGQGGDLPGVMTVLGYLISHKGALRHLWKFYQNGRRARVALGESVAAIIKDWP